MWGDSFGVRIGTRYSDNSRWAIAQPVQFIEQRPEDEGVETPVAFSLNKDSAQSFMDELWNCGIRPSEGTGSAGSLAATQKHLEDMRSLVFKTPPK